MEIIIQTTACCTTDPGLRRSHNEDACLIDNAGGFFLVADGVGGAAAGEIASNLFVKATADIFSESSTRSLQDTLEKVSNSFLEANSRISADIAITPSHAGMGCTAELLAVHTHGYVLGHIGDSRTYRLRQTSLTQMTKDHSLVQEQLDQGLLTPDQARTHPMKNVILRAVDGGKDLAIDLSHGHLVPGDIFLLCTDGLSDMIDDDQIRTVLVTSASLAEKAEQLVGLANAAGGRDNVTVALVEVR